MSTLALKIPLGKKNQQIRGEQNKDTQLLISVVLTKKFSLLKTFDIFSPLAVAQAPCESRSTKIPSDEKKKKIDQSMASKDSQVDESISFPQKSTMQNNFLVYKR